ncbi:MAG: hypothetical protein CL920_17140 [Deltaproteobacteria bacterium]|nr:hypothetical protein [Deltaproteobacteria bacterium]
MLTDRTRRSAKWHRRESLFGRLSVMFCTEETGPKENTGRGLGHNTNHRAGGRRAPEKTQKVPSTGDLIDIKNPPVDKRMEFLSKILDNPSPLRYCNPDCDRAMTPLCFFVRCDRFHLDSESLTSEFSLYLLTSWNNLFVLKVQTT